jgi:hypothetical protein
MHAAAAVANGGDVHGRLLLLELERLRELSVVFTADGILYNLPLLAFNPVSADGDRAVRLFCNSDQYFASPGSLNCTEFNQIAR